MKDTIWFKTFTVEEVQKVCENTMVSELGIKFLEIGNDFLKAEMPVNAKTVQPVRILHGGANVVLAESLGSLAAYMVIDSQKFVSVGLEINANHIKSVQEGGKVYGTAQPIHIGRRTHIWEIKIKDHASDKLVCVSRITVAILPKEK